MNRFAPKNKYWKEHSECFDTPDAAQEAIDFYENEGEPFDSPEIVETSAAPFTVHYLESM